MCAVCDLYNKFIEAQYRYLPHRGDSLDVGVWRSGVLSFSRESRATETSYRSTPGKTRSPSLVPRSECGRGGRVLLLNSTGQYESTVMGGGGRNKKEGSEPLQGQKQSTIIRRLDCTPPIRRPPTGRRPGTFAFMCHFTSFKMFSDENVHFTDSHLV